MIFDSIQKKWEMSVSILWTMLQTVSNCIAYGINRYPDNLSGHLTIQVRMSMSLGKVFQNSKVCSSNDENALF